MSDFITMGSMAEMLAGYLNTSTIRDSNYEIAFILLKNYDRVRKMSQKQMAELCFVSEASISRFCRFMGFENFHDFKAQMDMDFSVKSDYSHRLQNLLDVSTDKAIGVWRNELTAAIENTVNKELFQNASILAEMIHEAKKVSFFSHHFLWDTARFLQSKLLMMGKHTDAMKSYEQQYYEAKMLDESSLAIICTVGGTWFSRYPDLFQPISTSKCKIAVMTQNLSNPYLNQCDFVMPCGVSNIDDTGKYAMLCAMDAVTLMYMKKYGE